MGLFDYGSGNLHPVTRALVAAGDRVILTGGTWELKGYDVLAVPGVGIYATCMAELRAARGVELLVDWLPIEKPLLDICVRHQILFGEGTEHGICAAGLGLWSETVWSLAARRFLHMGWNCIDIPPGNRLFAGIENERFYLVRSYAATRMSGTDDALVVTTTHEVPFVAAVEHGDVCSIRFHSKKSGEAGTRLLRN